MSIIFGKSIKQSFSRLADAVVAACTPDDLSNLQESSAKVEAKAAEFKEQAAGIHTFIHIDILPH